MSGTKLEEIKSILGKWEDDKFTDKDTVIEVYKTAIGHYPSMVM